MRRFGPHQCLQRFDGWERRAVFVNELSQRAAVAFTQQTAGQQRQVYEASGLLPRAEGAGGNIVTDAFGGTTEK